ncbi:protein adenylyltransferase SelO [Clostridium butyricum]
MKHINISKEAGFKLENSYANLSSIFFTIQNPEHVPSPHLEVLNYSLAEKLGLDAKVLQSKEGVEILSGNKTLEGFTPISQAYAGHQFGYFTILGDGRAVLIGEHITPEGKKVDIQLKGAGKTPYSRGGDGKSSLGPMLREYIISEGMNGLGIPTTRSLAVVTTGENVIRERLMKGAILTRVAKSHIRVGTFEYAGKFGSFEEIRELADYTIERHFKEFINEENKYLLLLREVVKHQAHLIAKWQLVGFIHGVMNTDNMAISGETIDYGPCAFMDNYDPETVFSSIDVNGRYAYGNQPKIAVWNLARFAESLLTILHNDKNESVKLAQNEISKFVTVYNENYISGMRAKLGIFNEEENDEILINQLLNIMKKYNADYTNTFRSLTMDKTEDTELYGKEEFNNWYKMWQERLIRQAESKELSRKLMRNNNPSVIPRNHRVEEALEAAVKNNDYTVMRKLLDAITKPYDYSVKNDYYVTVPKTSCGTYKTYCGT